ncbi:MAG: ATP phosphoribosyltransferase regulatory subunit, partial [Brevinematales bacterium]
DIPLRYYYCEDVLREQPLHKGKLRQMKQAGVELIGAGGPEADAEITALLGKTLGFLDREYRIVMGDVGLYKYILTKMDLAGRTAEAVHKLYNLKDTVALSELIENSRAPGKYKKLFLELPYITGNAAAVTIKLRNLPGEFHPYFERLLSLEKALPDDIRGHVILDMGLIKDFSYYTSLTLEGYIRNSGYPAAGGGRYDRLFESWGKDYPAVGFALDVGLYNNIFKKRDL